MQVKNRFVPPTVGERVTLRKTMTVAEQAMYTGISGNLGPLYVDRNQARRAGLENMAVFELAVASLLTTCLSRLAGPEHRITEFETRYHRAIPVGTTVEAEARLENIDRDKLTFELICRAGEGTLCVGRAVLVPAAAG